MGNAFETNFIPKIIEKTPFADTPSQTFFAKWCEINDSIVPQFVSRENWQKRGMQGILEKNDQGKQTLFLPEDLHLWEMIDVIKTVDYDTFARKPEKRENEAEKIRESGIIFEKAGLYLEEYLPIFKEKDTRARQIAEDIAREFYRYGLLLQKKEQPSDEFPQANSLSSEDKAQLDEWFLGKDVYQKRLARLGENPTEEQKEEIRKKLINVYFNALAREGYRAKGEKPWETEVGPMQHLQDRTKEQITRAIENPERKLKTTFFKRGVEKLVTQMREVGWKKNINDFLKKVGFNPLLEQKKLYDTLRIDKLKADLEDIKKTGDVSQISAKELEIAKKIQKAVSSFPYQGSANNPSEMVENQFINCVGSSVLGGGLLDELGIEYLHAVLPEHSITFLVTSNKKVYWQDFTPPGKSSVNYTEITPDMLEGKIDSFRLTDIPESGLTVKFKKWQLDNKSLRVNLFNPEIGLQCNILNNTGNVLNKIGRKEEAIEAYKQAINIDSKNANLYNGLGNALNDLGRKEEAIEVYKQAINIDPKYANLYNGLGNALNDLGRKEEAIEAYKQAISVNPKDTYPYNGLGNALNDLGRKEEAIEVYKQAINIDPKYAYPYNGLGNALNDLGRKEEAIEAYRQATSVDPKYARPHNGLGNVLNDLGRKEEAIEAYKTFKSLWKGDKYLIKIVDEIIQGLEKE